MPQVERRRAPRAKFSGAVIVNTSGREFACVASDLSELGMLLFPPRGAVPATGMPVQVRFTLPKPYRWVACRATVVREASVRRRRGWGVAFHQMAPDLRRAIHSYVTVGPGTAAAPDPNPLTRK